MTQEIPTSDACGGDGAAYVLGALEPAEAHAYRRHLSACTACRDEVTALQRVADVLPVAVPQYRLPRALRRRVVRTVRAESRRTRRRPALRPTLRPAFRPALAGAFAIVLVLVVAGLFTLRGGGAGQKVIEANVRGSTGTAALRISAGQGELVVRHLPAPARGRIYEVWLKRPNAAPAPTAALFSVGAGGAADVGIPGTLNGVSSILVTDEPAGGSRVPTGPAVIVVRTS
jgi:anti-sigma-K factor RskA